MILIEKQKHFVIVKINERTPIADQPLTNLVYLKIPNNRTTNLLLVKF